MKIKKTNRSTAFVFVTILLWIGSFAGAQSLTESELVEGTGLGAIVVGKSTLGDVVQQYGGDYEVIEHLKYSYEYSYPKLGLSFYSCRADSNNEIFVLVTRKPFQARTAKGIILGKSTKSDVERLYGGGEVRGVEFFYNAKDRVEEIDIFEDAGITQCDDKFGIVGD